MRRVHLYGTPPGTARTPTIAFSVNGGPSMEVAKKLAERGVFLSHGDFYALTMIERLGQAPTGWSAPVVPATPHRRKWIGC